MSKNLYVVGKTYLFIRLESVVIDGGKEEFELSSPSNIIADKSGIVDFFYFINTGKVCKRVLKNILFVELTCTEICESKCAHGSSNVYNGYLFKSKDNQLYSIQYPHASYSQTSTLADYVASKYLNHKTKNEPVNPTNFDDYILMSYMMDEIYDNINKTECDDSITECKYRDKEDCEKIISSIKFNTSEAMRKMFVFLLSVIPVGWKYSFNMENIITDPAKKPYYMGNTEITKI